VKPLLTATQTPSKFFPVFSCKKGIAQTGAMPLKKSSNQVLLFTFQENDGGIIHFYTVAFLVVPFKKGIYPTLWKKNDVILGLKSNFKSN